MPIIQVPEIGRRIREAFGVRGPVSIDTMAPEIVPVAMVSDLTELVLKPGELCVAARSQAGVAAQYTQFTLLPGPNSKLEIDRLIVAADAAADVLAGTLQTPWVRPGTIDDTYFRDASKDGKPSTTVSYGTNAAVFGGGATLVNRLRINVPAAIGYAIVEAPDLMWSATGSGVGNEPFFLYVNAVNTSVWLTVFFRELVVQD